METRGGAALFAFFFSAKGAGLDAAFPRPGDEAVPTQLHPNPWFFAEHTPLTSCSART
jgi:hypothetical protein